MGVQRPLLSSLKGGAAFFLPLAFLAACAGPSGSMRKTVNAKLAAGDFAGAEAVVTGAKESQYGRKNMVLYYLDLGAIQHDAGKFQESDHSFDAAERRMDELFTKSVSRETGRLMLNDNTTEYAGERFERALVNVYRALDHLFLGNREGALVEARKLSRLLQEFADTSAGKSMSYKDDAFAQYLTALLYDDDGKADDSRISMEKARKIYDYYKSVYGIPPPAFPQDSPGPETGELVFLHAAGSAPRKISKSFQVAWNQAVLAINSSKDDEADAGRAKNALRAGLTGNNITVSYPAYVQDPYRVSRSEVVVGGRVMPSQLVHDVSAIAMKDLAERQALIKTRAIARAAVKFILAKAAVDEVKKRYGATSLQAIAAQVAASATTAATEVADTRAWATLPSQFRLARLRLPPGTHDVTVRYMDAGGAVVSTKTFPNVVIRKGKRTYLRDRTAI